MKQKIVIKFRVRCNKCRSKAMEIAADTDGVISVALQGQNKDRVVVIGDGVDSASMAILLSKKLGYASLEIVEEIKEKTEVKKESKDTTSSASATTYYASSFARSQCEVYEMICDDPYPRTCSIM